ncbi:MAG: hypothetical protein Q4C95_07160 [Planctomycetia bacterium]|nr:hypothetical protein [Planctomycetia bacterium]
MPYELIYTSVDKGLKLGSRGFCTVACTTGLAQNIMTMLESLSGYRYLNPPNSDGKNNPVVYSSLIFQMNGREQHIISRIADAGLDYSNRSNKIAHHFLFTNQEYQQYNQAALLSNADSLFVSQWNQEPQWFPAAKTINIEPLPASVCQYWQTLTGDAGWAGVLANTALTGQNVCLIYSEDQNIQQLLIEALALLPTKIQWKVSFSSFYTKYPPGVTCQWKCILKGSQEESVVQMIPDSLVLNLTKPLPSLDISDDLTAELVALARTGSLENFHLEQIIAQQQTFSSFNVDYAKEGAEIERRDFSAAKKSEKMISSEDFFRLPEEDSSLLNQMVQVPVPGGPGDALKMQNVAIEELNKYYEALVKNNQINKQRNIIFTSVLIVSIAILITLIISVFQDNRNVKEDLEAVPEVLTELIEQPLKEPVHKETKTNKPPKSNKTNNNSSTTDSIKTNPAVENVKEPQALEEAASDQPATEEVTPN